MRRKLLVAALAVVILALVGAAWVWFLLRSAPLWYVPPDPRDANVASLAETAEYRLVEEYRKIRPEAERWTIRVREDQVNAWLAARMPEWIANRQEVDWPVELGVPQVRMTEAGIDVAVPAELDGGSHVLVMRLVPEIRDGQLRMGLERAGVGRANVGRGPAEMIAEAIAPFLEDEADQIAIMDVLSGRVGIQPIIDLGDSRLVEVVSVVLGDGVMEVTNRTE